MNLLFSVTKRPWRFILLALTSALLPLASHAQSDLGGRYVGSLNTKVSAGGFNIESGVGVYFADVDAGGNINLNGSLTGTVSAGGAVTFSGGSSFALLGLTSATIANGSLTSDYGALVGNGTTRYKINGSTGFTGVSGGTGGGSGGGGGGGGSTTTGDLLAHYSFDDPSDLFKDDSGGGIDLNAVNGTPGFVTGAVGAGAVELNNIRLRALVNSTFSADAVTVSYFVRLTGAGSWNPRMVAVLKPGTSRHYYGTFLDGTKSDTPRKFASYHEGSSGGNILYSADTGTLDTESNGAWHHVAMVHDGSDLRLYLDGEETSSDIGTAPLSPFTSAMLSIGGSDNGLDLFQGALDEIRIYNRSLTTAEISALVSGSAVGTAIAGSTAAPAAAITYDVIAGPSNLVGYRNRVGQSLQFSITGASSGSIWGSGIYTDDSSLSAAAVHAGLIAVGQTATVTVNIVGGKPSYAATSSNGITSRNWGSWGGSFSFADASNVTIGQVATVAPAVSPNFGVGNFSTAIGQRLVLPIQVDGVGPFSYQWFLNGNVVPGATSNPYIINSVRSSIAGNYTVRVANAAGSNTFNVGPVAVNAPGAPTFVLQPFDKVVAPGGTFALAASAAGANLSYQWYQNNVILNGETGSILLRNSASANDAGFYVLKVANSDGTITSQASNVTLSPTASTLRNISVRTNAAAGQVITPGFVINGSGSKTVLIRAIGPGLGQFGLTGLMPDPKITVYDNNQNVVASNDDWDATSVTPVAAAVGAFAITPASKDAALVVSLAANSSYTAQVTGSDGQGGLVILEVYDADTAPTSKLVNVSVRSTASSGTDALIMGVSLQGSGKRTLLVRGVGPTLGGFGVPGTAPDPQLNIFDVNQRSVLINDNWSNADFVYELIEASQFVGAFALSAGSNDAATLSLLDPGNYTIQITPTDATDGEVLAEIYEVP